MARRIPVELQLLAAEYYLEARRVEAATKAMDREMDQLDRSVDAVDRDMAELAAATELAKRQVDDLGDKARGTAGDLQLLDSRIAASKLKVRELGVEFARTGEAVDGRALGKERGLLQRLERLRKELSDLEDDGGGAGLAGLLGSASEFTVAGERAGGAFASGFSGGGGHGALIGALIAAIVAALPLIGALVGGAIIGAVGTGAMAAGILSATRDSRVKAAAKSFGAFLQDEFFAKSGANFAEPVIKGLDILKQAIADLKLDDLLEPLAPTVTLIARGIAAFVANLKTSGLEKLFERLPEFASIAADGFAELGGALGMFLDEVSSGPEALDAMRTLFDVLAGTVRFLGVTIGFLELQWHALNVVGADLSGVLEDVIPLFGPLNDEAEKLSGHTKALEGNIRFMTSATVLSYRALDPFAAYLKESSKNADSLKVSLDALFGVQMSLDEATLAWNQTLFGLNEELKKGKFNLDSTSESGLRHQGMVLDAIQSAQRLADATFEQTHSQGAANQTYAAATEQLRKFLTAAHLTKEQIDAIIGNYTITVTTYFKTVGKPPGAILGNLSGPAQDVRRAAGGPVGPGLTLVGEEGPEYLSLRNGQYGQVYNNTQTRQMAQYNGGSGSRDSNITLTVIHKDTSGRTLRTDLISDALNRNVSSSVVAAAYP